MNEILSRLAGVRSTGSDTWMAKCPSHDDRKQSLSIASRDGKILVKCHADCDTRDIVRDMGLTMADLMGPREQRPAPRASRITPAPPQQTDDGSTVYEYRDSSGTLIGLKTRFRDKTFSWDWNGEKPAHAPLYHAQALAQAKPGERCYLVEGEKDCDRLLQEGLLATTTGYGASGKWYPAYTDAMKPLQVVCLPDNDKPGKALMERAAAALRAAGCEVATVELPGLQEKQDVSDWLDAGHTLEELEQLSNAQSASGALSWDFTSWATQWAGELLKRARGEMGAIATPWTKLTELLGGGWLPGVHCLVGGTGSFKTQFALQCALKGALLGHPVCYISTEMPAPLFLSRIVGIFCGWPWSDVYRGRLDKLALPPGYTAQQGMESDEILGMGVEYTASRLQKAKLCLVCKQPYSLTVAGLELMLEQMPDGAMVVLDYIGLLGAEDAREDVRQRIDRAMCVLQSAVERRGLVILAVNATSRANYSALQGRAARGEDPPGVGHPGRFVGAAKESGGVEFTSTTLMVLVKEQMGDDGSDGATAPAAPLPFSSYQLAVAKNRLGPPGWVGLHYYNEKSVFKAGGG